MNTVTADQLARAFAASVLNQLDIDGEGRLRLRDNPTTNPCCVSHDYMDANVNMMEAYQQLAAVSEDDYELNDVTDLFNEAWDLARANHWYVADWQTVVA